MIMEVVIDQRQPVAVSESEPGNFVVMIAQNNDRLLDLGFIEDRRAKVPVSFPG
jgi:hypothetical protein